MSYEQMTGPELVAEFNKMAQAMGRPPVNRFANLDVARRRTAALAFEFKANPPKGWKPTVEITVEQPANRAHAEMTEASTYATPVKAAVEPTGLESLSLRQITDQYNALVAKCTLEGKLVKGKHHKSLFESKALGIRQLTKLMEEAAK